MSKKYLPSTSRDLDPTNYAWDSVVYQAGRPILDSELNLTQDVLKTKNTLPSGVLSYQGQDDSVGSFAFEKPYDNAGNLNANFTANGFVINPFKAIVNGMIIDVRNTNASDNTNNIVLPIPNTGSGAGNRGDFVFLEVWRREVTPSMSAFSRVRLVSPGPGSFLTIKKNGVEVRLDGVQGVVPNANQFLVSNSNTETARNLADAINNRDGANAGLTVDGVKTIAETRGTEFVFLTHNNGSNGNFDISDNTSFTLVGDNTGVRIISRPAGGSDGEGMTSDNKIYFNGNVLSPASTDLPDNIQDPNVSVSSTRRIQVQYRIRSFSNTDLSQQIFGFENTSVLAQGSKENPVGGYTFSRHDTDTGLWYAGTGTEAHATALGTVDGYVYAIPLCYVFRRNSNDGASGFSALGSFNTGALHDHLSGGGTLNGNTYVNNVAAKESDRPDGLFADQIVEQDILDLRRKVYPRGIDLAAELDYQYHSLLDGTNKTWFAKAHNLQVTGDGSGGTSHTPLVCDVYGREAFNNQNVGEWRQHFDHIARRWTNEPTTERAFVAIQPENFPQISTGVTCTKAVGTAGSFWHEDDVITIDVSALKVSSGLLWDDDGNNTFYNPSNNNNPPKLIDIGHIWHDDGHFVNKINQQVKVKSITGLGTNTVEITLLRNTQVANGGVQNALDYILTGHTGNVAGNGQGGGSTRRIFIELIFDYCSFDRGLSGVAVEVPTPDSSGYPTGPAILINNPPASALNPLYAGKGNGNPPPISNIIPNTKEVSLECVFTKTTDQFVSSDELGAYLPWRLYYNDEQIDGATDNIVITDESGVGTDINLRNDLSKFQHAESEVGFVGTAWDTGQRLISVSAYPLEAYPADDVTDSQILVFYRRPAPKTCGADFPIANPIVNSGANPAGVVPDELKLQPLSVGKDIQVFLKTHDHYPFFNPTNDFPTHFNAENATYLEHKELSSPEVFLDDLKINTGSVSLPSFVPFVTSVNVTLGDTNVNQVPRKDRQGRVYYPTMEDSSYFPSAFAKSMSGYHSDYKTVIPCLMKVVDDNHILYRKGEVVLVIFVKTAIWGQGVSVDMREEDLTDNFVAACVYRTRNQLLLGE